jgi:hypothetical protein
VPEAGDRVRRAAPFLAAALACAATAWAEPAPVSPSARAVVDSLLGIPSRAAAPAAPADALPPRAQRVVDLRAAEEQGDMRRAAAFYAPDSRVWFEARTGAGEPRGANGKDAFADWDRYFRARKDVRFVAAFGDSVEFRLVETNDFYRLLDRPPSEARLVYWFDADDRITGTLVQSVAGDAPSGPHRMAEFKLWAARHEPAELAYLLPGGKLVPDLARAKRWKTALRAWRRAAGLPAVA